MAETVKLTKAQAHALMWAERSPWGQVPRRTHGGVLVALMDAGLADCTGMITPAGRTALAKHREANNG